MQFLSLQYLRGLAALLVLFAHSFVHYLDHVPDFWGKCGQLGIQVFFVISGFIICYSVGTSRFDPGRFLLRRIIRIGPIYWLCTSLTALGILLAPSAFKTTRFELDYFFASILFIPTYRPGSDELIVPMMALGYTLNYEMFFYFVFMTLFFLQSTLRTSILVISFTLAIAIGQLNDFENPALHFYTSVQLAAFCGGIVICEIFRTCYDQKSTIRILYVIALASAVIAAPFLAIFTWKEFFGLQGHLIVSLFATSLSLALLCKERLRPIRIIPFLKLIGDASYSIYIAHMFLVVLAYNIVRRLGVDLSNPIVLSASGILTTMSALAGSLLFYFGIEKPFTEFVKRRLTDQRKLKPLPRET